MFDVCPNCGAEVPPGAKACPQCGSDENTGWSEEAHHSSLDLPEENFDYDEFVEREFGKGPKSRVPRGIHWVWWVVAVGLLAGFVIMFLHK